MSVWSTNLSIPLCPSSTTSAPPLSEHRHWHAFHSSWATYLSSQLNTALPAGYFAEANVPFGIEIDVAAFEEKASAEPVPAWQPPPPRASHPFDISDVTIEVDATIGRNPQQTPPESRFAR